MSNRLEAGYRLPFESLSFDLVPESRFGVTPYAAAQAQGMFLPAFAEYPSPSSSSQFALSYASRGYSVVRTELGAWLDYDVAFGDEMLKLYSRAAFAHDFENEGTAVAAFQQLPGSAFLINTAKPAANGALVTAGLEYRLIDGWSVLGKFDGEFSSTTEIYSGTGVVRKVW
ncbi:MAG: autotransporter outer membrane beta-barrel domain-containing protein [Methylovirgula sp.]